MEANEQQDAAGREPVKPAAPDRPPCVRQIDCGWRKDADAPPAPAVAAPAPDADVPAAAPAEGARP